MKLNNGIDLSEGLTYIRGGRSNGGRDYNMRIEISEPGTYGVFVEMEWSNPEIYNECEFTITNYSL